MKYYSKLFIATVVSMTLFLSGSILYAATFNFSPTSTEVLPDSTFDVALDIDAGTEQVAGTDIYLTYDATYLEVQTITDGDYFPQVENVPSTGRLYVSGFVNTQGDYKTGSGTVATVTFKALQEGVTTITYDCDPDQTDTSKIVQNDTAVTNILDCDSLQAHAVTISASATGSSSTTSTTSELPQSGVVEDMLSYAMWGGILVGIWVVLRLVLRIM